MLAELDRLILKAEDNMADIRRDIKNICPTYQPRELEGTTSRNTYAGTIRDTVDE